MLRLSIRDRPRVLKLGEIWLIAFADDVVLLSTSAQKLQTVISLLLEELKKFNLCMNLIKTESMTFLPPRTRAGVRMVSFSVNEVLLNQIEEFKYLGIFVCGRWGFGSHISRMQGRAEAAASELLRLVTTLDIRGPGRIGVFYRALVESQWHGLELMPIAVVEEIEKTRAHFSKKVFNLPSPTSNSISLVLLDLWPASYEAMSRRVSFARKMRDHDLEFVQNAFLFDRTVLMRSQTGWHHDSFVIFRSMFKSERLANFDFDRVTSRFAPIARSRLAFLFCLLQATDEVTMAPFRLFRTPDVLSSFREFLGTISRPSAELVLLFCSSGLRFRFFDRTTLKCPLCSNSSWLTGHLFSCPITEPLLARNGVIWEDFRASMAEGEWKRDLLQIHEVLTVWKNSFELRLIDDTMLQNLLVDAGRL
jgi:hypothetical protein